MEIPVQVAVRIKNPCVNSIKYGLPAGNDANGNPNGATTTIASNGNEPKQLDLDNARNNICVQPIPIAAGGGVKLDNGIAAGLIQVGPHSFPVTHALPMNCTQNQVYHQTVFPLITLFLEGFDASVVTYGQRGAGKTYSLYGHGFEYAYDESEQGVVQRCVREIYTHIAQHPERTYAVNIGWVEICSEEIRDLLGVGNVHCNSIADVFHWLQIGESSKLKALNEGLNTPAHSLFTLTLEQQWVSKEGLIQHRLSTASFSDLCGTERLFMLNQMERPTSLAKDLGLQALEHVVNTLTDPTLMYNVNGNVPYTQTTLTTLLKDSFGGRAQTLILLCISPFEQDVNETICNLQFGFKAQCVRNFVIMNTFSDDNTPISPENANDLNGNCGLPGLPLPSDNFGLQFAASQWFKLVSNAEGLLSKLISTNTISDADKEQIEEWLFLKQECEECLSSSEAIRSQKQLVPIQEAEEPDDNLSEPDTSCQQNSDNESDSESQRPDLEEKMELLMEELVVKTDKLVLNKHQQYMNNQPKPCMDSQDSLQQQLESTKEVALPLEQNHSPTEKQDERKQSVGGRRRSIQPGSALSSAEIAMLNRVATREQSTVAKPHDDFLDSSTDLQAATHLRAVNNSPLENIQKKLRKLDTDIEARTRQIKEVEQTMQLKQNIISELIKNSETRSHAKQRFNKKKAKLEAEYEKTKKQLAKAIMQGKDKMDLDRLTALIGHIEQRLSDLTSMKHIAGESGQKVKKLQQSVHESKKLMDELQKKVKKEKKLREQLQAELKQLKDKEQSKALVKHGNDLDLANEELQHGKQLKEVQSRISHLDHVLREKSENLEQYAETEEKEGLRHEIRNLRRTRDHLLDQRCSLDRKLKREKMLSQREERKLLECDEAIEAIDAAIEFKNELICGHKSIDTSESLQREKGEQMLMARLNKLSPEEMRTLLYKYFTKVIDLRTSSLKLEMQLMQQERERDAWEWKERVLSNAVRQARLEGERNAVLLQRQHEMKLTLMLRHLAEETSASSSFTSEQGLHAHGRYGMRPMNLALQPHQGLHTPTTTTTTTTPTPTASESDFDLDFYKHALPAAGGNVGKLIKPHKHADLEMCPIPDALSKYKPLDKFKEKERETKNKLFAKFQVLTRYAGQAVSMSESDAVGHNGGGASSTSKKNKDKDALAAAIPQQNLKLLKSQPSATKVTRQKNKIIIQDATRKS